MGGSRRDGDGLDAAAPSCSAAVTFRVPWPKGGLVAAVEIAVACQRVSKEKYQDRHWCKACAQIPRPGNALCRLLLLKDQCRERGSSQGSGDAAWGRQRTARKPPEGAACNGRGLCCAVQLCALAVEFLDSAAAPCPAMEFADSRFWCGLVRHPNRYFGTPSFSNRLIGPLVHTALSIGEDCDSSD